MQNLDSQSGKSSITRLDHWIRNRFPILNTVLEKNYEADRKSGQRQNQSTRGRHLLEEGSVLIDDILGREQNLGSSFDDLFGLLGNVGLFMAACTRHGLNPPVNGASPLVGASRLAIRLGKQLDVAPRFLAAHLSLLNPAQNGRYKLFTNLESEKMFIDYNTRGMLAYQSAARALKSVLGTGVSGRWAVDLLAETAQALETALASARWLFANLEVESFFYHVRPYYRPHSVGQRIYRGANAGDFAAINEVDLILGLCSANDPFYQAVLREKRHYLLPTDRASLDRTSSRVSLLDQFLEEAHASGSLAQNWWRPTVEGFLEVCRLHGAVAAVHHNALVDRFISRPARNLAEDQLQEITASGPTLAELVPHLEKLRDLRLAANRADIQSRHGDLEFLKQVKIRCAEGGPDNSPGHRPGEKTQG